MADDSPVTSYIAKIKALHAELTHLAPHQSAAAAEEAAMSPVPTVFISWAHANEGWSRAQIAAWQGDVATLAATLRSLGVDADVDLFHLDESTDWTRYGPTAIVDNDFTLVVLSAAWAERWSGKNRPTAGAGAAAEADTLHGLFSKNQAQWQRRLVFVMLPDVSDDVIPPDLHRVPRVYIDPDNPDDYEGLLRLLTRQPSYLKTPLGRAVALPPVASSGSVEELQARLAEVQQQAEADVTNDDATEVQRRRALREAALRAFIDVARQSDDRD